LKKNVERQTLIQEAIPLKKKTIVGGKKMTSGNIQKNQTQACESTQYTPPPPDKKAGPLKPFLKPIAERNESRRAKEKKACLSCKRGESPQELQANERGKPKVILRRNMERELA